MSLAACISRWPSTTRWPWLRERALAEVGLEHRGLRLLDLEEQRVVVVAAEQQRRSSSACRRCRRRRPCGRGRRSGSSRAGGGGRPAACGGSRGAARGSALELLAIAGLRARSAIGTSSGGSLTNRGSPSTIVGELRERPSGCPWSAPSSTVCCDGLQPGGRLRSPQSGQDRRRRRGGRTRRRGSASRRSAASLRGRSGPTRDDGRCAGLRSKPRSRPAISKLAASRFTSHSNGPGSVSSKSLRSKTRVRSGEANPPKLARWASPQSCTFSPARGRRRQVGGHHVRRAAVEGERRDEHAAVADRARARARVGRLRLEDRDRVTVGSEVERRVARARALGARGATPRDPLGRR